MFCPIVELSVESFERNDDTIYYPIKIKLYTNQTIKVQYEYVEFIQFSKVLFQEYPIIKKHQLLKLTNKKYYHFFSKSSNLDKQLEIEVFCKQLLMLPNTIQSSNIFISFFLNKYYGNQSNRVKRTFSLKNKSKSDIHTTMMMMNTINEQENVYHDPYFFHPLATTPSPTSPPSTPPATPTTTADDQLKFKIIYDKNNIIMLRLPRSITLYELKLRVIEKFSLLNVFLPNDFCFAAINHRHSNIRYSIISTSTISTFDSFMEDTLIVKQQDFTNAMQEKWFLNQKVTLKCVLSSL